MDTVKFINKHCVRDDKMAGCARACVCERGATAPVDSVDAHDEGLYIGVGRAAELAASLCAEGCPVTKCESVQRADGRTMGHHCPKEKKQTNKNTTRKAFRIHLKYTG